MNVGTRELKNRLSYYLRRVSDGEPVYVTDRGSVVAELRGIRLKKSGALNADRKALLELAAEGYVALGSGTLRKRAPLRIKAGKSLSAMLLEDRG